ncbi:MAG: chorismate lyase [Mariprofundaceae bacterium]
MFLSWPTEQEWIAAAKWSAAKAGASPEISSILLITGSLTRRLNHRCGMRLALKVREQFVDRCEKEEAILLECAVSAPCLRRRVSLLHRREVMFDAESVLPLEFLPAEMMEVLREGKQPLGNVLIDRGLMLARSDLKLARLRCPDHVGEELRWARSSVLRSESGERALVTECFHSAMWQHLEILQRRS